VPVIPVAMVNSQFVPSKLARIPIMRRPGIRFGRPIDFTRYAASGNDRDVLRWVTDEIMNAVMELSGQEYVDAYGASVKAAMEDGRTLKAPVLSRPGEGRPVPPVPAPPVSAPPVSAPSAPAPSVSAPSAPTPSAPTPPVSGAPKQRSSQVPHAPDVDETLPSTTELTA